MEIRKEFGTEKALCKERKELLGETVATLQAGWSQKMLPLKMLWMYLSL